jgi:hypothetical protein
MSKGIEGVPQSFKLLFEKYSEALGQFDTRPSPFPEKEDDAVVIDWMLTGFKALPNVIFGASDFAVVFNIESLLKLLEIMTVLILRSFVDQFGHSRCCKHICIHANEDVRAVKLKFMKEF